MADCRSQIACPWMVFLGVVLALAGYLGPWVDHRTAALTVTGAEFSEFAKFFPQVQGGVAPVTRELFLSPLITGAVLLGLVANRWSRRPVARLAATGLAVLLGLAALPPYQFLLDRTYRSQLVLASGGALLVTLTLLASRLPPRLWGGLVAFLALVEGGLAPWQFGLLRPLVVALYDAPLAVGWGLVACVAGSALVLVGGILAAIHPGCSGDRSS